MRTVCRKTLAPGVYLDGQVLEIRATSNGHTRIERLPGDTDLAEAKRRRAQLLATVSTQHPKPKSHTLAADAETYLRLQRHLSSYGSLDALIRHWLAPALKLAGLSRHRITAQHVREARSLWLAAGAAAKSVNHRVAALKHLYRVLDGPKADTPCDGIAPLSVPRTPIQRVSDETILKVDAELQRREARTTLRLRYDGAKTRARFRVLVSTGKRPSELKRAEPGDVDLKSRVWVVRDGKGGWSPGLYLNEDMLAAWRLFISEDAWGPFNSGNFARVLRSAGWPKDVRVYNARHATWIAAVERGADMADVQQGAGHRSLRTTVHHYTGVRASRMQRLSETLEGRFGGFPHTPPHTDTTQHRTKPNKIAHAAAASRRGAQQRKSRKVSGKSGRK